MRPPTFGQTLRTWRERTSPAWAGIASGVTVRRTPGLRREELARAALISEDYLQRLETDRARPSRDVVLALARALRVSDGAMGELLSLAGQVAPSGVVPRELTPSVERFVTRLKGAPVVVYDATWTWVGANSDWCALFPDLPSGTEGGHNAARLQLTRSPLLPSLEDSDENDRYFVSELRRAAARYPHDAGLAALLNDLGRLSRFRDLWEAAEVVEHRGRRVVVPGGSTGSATFVCDVLVPDDVDLRVVVFSADRTAPTASGGVRTRVARIGPGRDGAVRPQW